MFCLLVKLFSQMQYMIFYCGDFDRSHVISPPSLWVLSGGAKGNKWVSTRLVHLVWTYLVVSIDYNLDFRFFGAFGALVAGFPPPPPPPPGWQISHVILHTSLAGPTPPFESVRLSQISCFFPSCAQPGAWVEQRNGTIILLHPVEKQAVFILSTFFWRYELKLEK